MKLEHQYFSNWGVGTKLVNKNDVSFGLPNVLVDENRNLINPQKEVSFWHHKLGVAMHHIQQLMKIANAVKPNGRRSVKDRTIICTHVQLCGHLWYFNISVMRASKG